MTHEPNEFEAAVAAYFAASRLVWNDRAVWIQEARRVDAAPLLWPPRTPPTRAQRFVMMLAMADVDVVLSWLRVTADPLSPGWPPSVDDPKMQTVLRVVLRSMQAGEAALGAGFGGLRITGRRAYLNKIREQWTALALQLARRDGLTRDQAFERMGIPRRQAFRAAKRATKRK